MKFFKSFNELVASTMSPPANIRGSVFNAEPNGSSPSPEEFNRWTAELNSLNGQMTDIRKAVENANLIIARQQGIVDNLKKQGGTISTRIIELKNQLESLRKTDDRFEHLDAELEKALNAAIAANQWFQSKIKGVIDTPGHQAPTLNDTVEVEIE